jgi:hypothetical protein
VFHLVSGVKSVGLAGPLGTDWPSGTPGERQRPLGPPMGVTFAIGALGRLQPGRPARCAISAAFGMRRRLPLVGENSYWGDPGDGGLARPAFFAKIGFPGRF